MSPWKTIQKGNDGSAIWPASLNNFMSPGVKYLHSLSCALPLPADLGFPSTHPSCLFSSTYMVLFVLVLRIRQSGCMPCFFMGEGGVYMASVLLTEVDVYIYSVETCRLRIQHIFCVLEQQFEYTINECSAMAALCPP